MRRPRLPPPLLLSDAIITGITSEVSATGKAQIIRDAQCPGLHLLVVHSRAPLWTLTCLNHNRRREVHTLGNYPRVGVTQARAKGWNLRMRRKLLEMPKVTTSQMTLGRLIFLYDGHPASNKSEMRDRLCHIFEPFLFTPWSKIDWEKIQDHIDTYSGPGSLRRYFYLFRGMLLWAEEQGLVAQAYAGLVPPKARSKAELQRLQSRRDVVK
jgi:hypothetical protein